MTDTNDVFSPSIRKAIRQLRNRPDDLVNVLEKCLYDMHARLEATKPGDGETDIDLHVRQLLAKQRKIVLVWCTDDLLGLRPDLSEEQAWEVLQRVENIHGADYGTNWATLQTVASDLFPEPADTQEGVQ